jgi:hypothetical protein
MGARSRELCNSWLTQAFGAQDGEAVVDVLCVSNRFLGAVIDMAEEGLGAL